MSLIILPETDTPLASAQFAWSPQHPSHGLDVRLFRLSFEIGQPTTSLLLHLSADSRYKLYLDGEFLGRGPARGSLRHYHYETYDLAPLLQPGRHTLAAEVRWYGINAPGAEVHSDVPGLLAFSPDLPDLNTPGDWRVFELQAVSPNTERFAGNGQAFLNHMDDVDLRQWPLAWTDVDFDDSDWPRAIPTTLPSSSRRPWGVEDKHQLFPRDIPALAEDLLDFETHRAGDQGEFKDIKPFPWSIPANESGSLTFDTGAMTTGFPVLQFEGGKDRIVTITYAEALGHWTGNEERPWEKRRRDDPKGVPHGHADQIILRGDDLWEPFHWRGFRYVRLGIEAGPEPVALRRVQFRQCVYPQQRLGEFESSDPQSRQMWETSWRTLRACSHENYDDSPTYEQFSYILDTRLECLQSYYLCNQTRLPRRCIRLFLDTLREDGLIDSRVPSHHRQTIPYFCLHWILMVQEYWDWVGPAETDFIQRCLTAVDTILVWFRQRLRDDDFIGPLPPWNMVDRAATWPGGEPPAVVEGGSTYLTALFAQAASAASRLHQEAGSPEDARRWQPLANRIRRSLRKQAWNRKEGLFDDGARRPGDHRSQHAQFAAINAGAATPAQRRRIAQRIFDRDELYLANFSQSYDLARGLEAIGRYDLFHTEVLGQWRTMLSAGATTWWEYPDPTRSDCHAWSAWISVDFLRTVLGARPAKPGWQAISLAPQFDQLDWARGSLETPTGPIQIEWSKTSNDEVAYHATTPNLPVEVHFPDGSRHAFPQGGPIHLQTRSHKKT